MCHEFHASRATTFQVVTQDVPATATASSVSGASCSMLYKGTRPDVWKMQKWFMYTNYCEL